MLGSDQRTEAKIKGIEQEVDWDIIYYLLKSNKKDKGFSIKLKCLL